MLDKKNIIKTLQEEKEKIRKSKEKRKKVEFTLNAASFVSNYSSLLRTIVRLLIQIGFVSLQLTSLVFPILLASLSILNNSFRAYSEFAASKETGIKYVFRVFSPAACVVLAILALCLSSLSLIFTLSAISMGTLTRLADCGASLYDFYGGEWRKIKNDLRKHNEMFFGELRETGDHLLDQLSQERHLSVHDKISNTLSGIYYLDQLIALKKKALFDKEMQLARRIHKLVSTSLSLVGCILFFVAPGPVGGAILLAVGIHITLSKFGMNPLTDIPATLYERSQRAQYHSSAEEIRRKINKIDKKTPQSTHNRYSAFYSLARHGLLWQSNSSYNLPIKHVNKIRIIH
ncbi:MAG TPA: hypothetical protein VNC84_03830 [Gammaproteobacteria bacterium]|jgi:hypothetical protein|nr:hypothetical protein [Gammaproteobacteria bacterium]